MQSNDFTNVAKYLLVFITRYSIIGNLDSAGMEDLLFKLAREVRSAVKDDSDKPGSKQAVDSIKQALSANSPDDNAVKAAVVKETTVLDSSDAKYLMKRLANYMQDPQKQVVVGDTSLEAYLSSESRETVGMGRKSQSRKTEPLTWHIGNLTIFGKKANKGGKLRCVLKQPKFAASQVEMTKQIASQYNKWDETTILDRAAHLAKPVVEVWNFANPSRV